MTLLDLQRRMADAIMRPLAPGYRLAAGADVDYVKPNDRLTARERVEIYGRSYWFRLLDSLYDDFPGLRAIVGQRAFQRLSKAYLAECPSQSYTMRNLGSRLEGWLRRNPSFAGANPAIALDMVRLEWAHVEAFDGEGRPPAGPEDLLDLGPSLRLDLQPYISLLDLAYPVDDLRVKLESNDEHEAASNAVLRTRERRLVTRFARLKPERIFLAVHRFDLTVYYRRLDAGEFRVLEAIRSGMPIQEALESALAGSEMPLEELRQMLQAWFSNWAELGWFAKPLAEGVL